MPPISLHTAYGNQRRSFPIESWVRRRSPCTTAGPEDPGAPTIDEEVVMTPRPRVPMCAHSLRPQVLGGTRFSRDLHGGEHGLISRLHEAHHGGNGGTF